jgi:hypothetical protein
MDEVEMLSLGLSQRVRPLQEVHLTIKILIACFF